jgi:surface protein
MFKICKFNKCISGWNVSNVNNMYGMFYGSEFNSDISQWDVSSVTEMANMFFNSKFKEDVSNWNTKNVQNIDEVFDDDCVNEPYWASIEDQIEREKAYVLHILQKKLNSDLMVSEAKELKNKI